jgi:thioesterase domain-containing protein/acyl carrier protein
MDKSLQTVPAEGIDRGVPGALLRAAPTSPRPRTADGGATTHAERQLIRLLRESFDVKSPNIDDDFFEMGGDSLVAAGLFARIECEFGVELSLDVLLERPTIRALAELLENPRASHKSAIVTIQAGNGRAPLFCLPGIGGNVLEFRRLVEVLGSDQPVYGVPPAGLNDEQPPHRTVSEMATYAIQQVRTIQPSGPYFLAGYSLGGVVAFEVAQQLRSSGIDVGLLALLDSYVWSPSRDLTVLEKVRLHWQNLYRNSNRGRMHYLSARWRLLLHRIRRGNLRRTDEDLIEGLALSPASRKIARMHWEAWRAYKPRVYDGVLTLFIARDDPGSLFGINGLDPTLGWSPWTTQKIDVHYASSTHLEIVQAKELEVLKKRLAVV